MPAADQLFTKNPNKMTTITSTTTPSMPMLPINVPILRHATHEARMHQDNYRLGHLHHLHHQFQGALRTPKDDQPSSPLSYPINPNEVRFDHHHMLGEQPVSSVLAYQSDLLERLNVVSTMHKANDDYSDTRSSSVSSFQADSLHQLDAQDDRLSCCSEDSELSVGKEEDGGVQTSSSSSMFHLSSKHASIRRTLPIPDEDMEDSCSRTPLTQISNCSVEDISNESLSKSSPMTPPNPLRFPIVRPSPTRLQEEFLRNSQIYAEELMKHQMSFLAATKGLHMPPNKPMDNDSRSTDSKAGFRPLIRNQPAQETDMRWPLTDDRNISPNSTETTHFRGIHSHLNAISKITSALGRDLSSLKSPVGSMNSRESSQSPPNHYNQMLLNQNMLLNDSNLKFSIDNILKPSFGRRITDPLLKRSKTGKKTVAQKAAAQQRNLQKLQAATERHGTPIDLTASMIAGPAASTTPFSDTSTQPSDITNVDSASVSTHHTSEASASSDQILSPAIITANTSDLDKVSSSSTSSTTTTSSSASSSSSPMVWPAWVYCTRYSDRPSSGTKRRTFTKSNKPSKTHYQNRTTKTNSDYIHTSCDFLYTFCIRVTFQCDMFGVYVFGFVLFCSWNYHKRMAMVIAWRVPHFWL